MSLYVKLAINFYSHRKTRKLRLIIGDAAFWVPPRLWAYAAEHQPDGDFSTYDSEELAGLIGYASSNASSMRQALEQSGFMDPDGKIHDWDEHSAYHSKFSERSKKAANARWEKERTKEKEEDIDNERERESEQALHKQCLTHELARTPTLKDVQEEAASTGMSAPHDYCAHYHAKKEEQRTWLNSRGKLIDWKKEFSRWWASDSATWGKNAKSKTPAASRISNEKETASLREELNELNDELQYPRYRTNAKLERRKAIEARLDELKKGSA